MIDAHTPRSLRCGREVLRFSLFESEAVFRKKSALALSLGAVAAGEVDGRQRGRPPSGAGREDRRDRSGVRGWPKAFTGVPRRSWE